MRIVLYLSVFLFRGPPSSSGFASSSSSCDSLSPCSPASRCRWKWADPCDDVDLVYKLVPICPANGPGAVSGLATMTFSPYPTLARFQKNWAFPRRRTLTTSSRLPPLWSPAARHRLKKSGGFLLPPTPRTYPPIGMALELPARNFDAPFCFSSSFTQPSKIEAPLGICAPCFFRN